MKTTVAIVLAAALSACGGRNPAASTVPPKPGAAGLRIAQASIYVDDQDRALRFYTDVLGFAEKDDVTNGPYRWLTVTAPGDPDGTELHLALDDSPAGKAYQEALFAQGRPAVMFYTDDVRADHARLAARGAEFTMPPTEVEAGSQIAILKDGCGNLIQLTQLVR
jgi:predicted enzyme related to lactoylglutathione lyase